MAARRRPLIARSLGWFWSGIGVVVLGGATTLQTLGPPAKPPKGPMAEPPMAAASPAMSPPPPADVITPTPPPEAKPPMMTQLRPGRGTPGPIPSPDPALLEAIPGEASAMLPRISADGRAPMAVYARGFDQSNRRPRIGLLFCGFGPNLGDSEDAIRALPGGITLAFSPYASHLPHLLDVARLTGHEFLLSIPMEPMGYPQNDAGDRALLTTANTAINAASLDWALGRMAGYAGATGALGSLRGERFADAYGPLEAMLRQLAGRGLMYVDPRPGAMQLPDVWSRAIDLVVDEPAVRTEIDDKLAQLEKAARQNGSALGLAGVVRPLTVQRVLAWANALQDHGFALAPVSALVRPPAAPPPGPMAAPSSAALESR
jgi:polysaccharide deacetylase 2 family uncharacterized protein YibQ